MIFAIDESGGLHVFADENELRRDLEEIDVVSSVYSLFRDDGRALVVCQAPDTRSTWRKALFGSPTAYTLRVAGAEDHEPELLELQSDINHLDAPRHFGTVSEVIEYVTLRRRGET